VKTKKVADRSTLGEGAIFITGKALPSIEKRTGGIQIVKKSNYRRGDLRENLCALHWGEKGGDSRGGERPS